MEPKTQNEWDDYICLKNKKIPLKVEYVGNEIMQMYNEFTDTVEEYEEKINKGGEFSIEHFESFLKKRLNIQTFEHNNLVINIVYDDD